MYSSVDFINAITDRRQLKTKEEIIANMIDIFGDARSSPAWRIIKGTHDEDYGKGERTNPMIILTEFFYALLEKTKGIIDRQDIIDNLDKLDLPTDRYKIDQLKQNLKTPTNENKMNNKLRQLIRESINEYIREIDEAGNVAALEAKMAKTQEAIETREKKVNMEGIDEAYHDMLDKGKLKELSSEIKALKKSLAKYEKQLEKLKNKGKKSEEPKEETEKEIVDEVNIDENFPEAGPELEETELNESFLHMQKLAGLITETEYKKKTNQ
jgi:hypothetical protein